METRTLTKCIEKVLIYDSEEGLSAKERGKLRVEITKSVTDITHWQPDSERIDLYDSSELSCGTGSPDPDIEKIAENLGTIVYKAGNFFQNGFADLSLRQQKREITSINNSIKTAAGYRKILLPRHVNAVIHYHERRIVQLSEPYLKSKK